MSALKILYIFKNSVMDRVCSIKAQNIRCLEVLSLTHTFYPAMSVLYTEGWISYLYKAALVLIY